jgi:hypothetical protein
MSLGTLRADPLNSCLRNVYRTGPARGSFTDKGDIVEGGRCTIGCDEVETGFYDLKATASSYQSNDYFYPWLQRGIGWVKVPKAVPDGTIVMTGGVNGCTLVVTELLTSYYFYHDGDSKYLYPGLTTGNEIARVAPKDYDPLGWGQKMFASALGEAARAGVQPQGDTSYGHFVVAVKKEGRFGFYSTGVMSLNGLTKLPIGLSPCIVTFA